MKWFFIFLFAFGSLTGNANDSTKLYNPYADASKDVALALIKAKKEKKQVLLQIGGNWCVNCYRLNSLIRTDVLIKQLVESNYVVYHLNYSPENKNLPYLKKLGYPQRFGFPVLVVLDGETGAVIHTQDVGLLEKGNGYDAGKIKLFLKGWSRGAFDEALYKE
jgi:thiol:disulfide interchange protein